LVFIVVGVILMIAFIFMRLRYRPPITCIEAKSHRPNHIEISWSDEDEDDVTYTIYWSNKPGIKVGNNKTYLGSKAIKLTEEQKEKKKETKEVQTNIKTRDYEWIYVVITKEDYVSQEIEVNEIRDRTFVCKNFDIRLLNRANIHDYLTLELDVLEDAEIYRFYHYMLDNGDTTMEDFNVKGFNRIALKLHRYDNEMVYVTKVVNGKEYDKEFIMYNETIDNNKFTHLCRI